MAKRPGDNSRLRHGLRRVARAGGRLGRRLGRSGGDPPVPDHPVAVAFVLPDGTERRGEVDGGATLLAAAIQLRVELSHYCGGMCSCGTCRVEVVDGAALLSRPVGNEAMVLGAARAESGQRLACQARVLGPVVVRVPTWF